MFLEIAFTSDASYVVLKRGGGGEGEHVEGNGKTSLSIVASSIRNSASNSPYAIV